MVVLFSHFKVTYHDAITFSVRIKCCLDAVYCSSSSSSTTKIFGPVERPRNQVLNTYLPDSTLLILGNQVCRGFFVLFCFVCFHYIEKKGKKMAKVYIFENISAGHLSRKLYKYVYVHKSTGEISADRAVFSVEM